MVSVGGLPATILSASDSSITIELGPDVPGSAKALTLSNSEGSMTWPGALLRYPALRFSPNGLGQPHQLEVHNGEPGVFAVAYSSELFAAPAEFLGSGWYHGLELNGVWILASGSNLPGTLPTPIALEAPTSPALAGVTLHLQALTTQSSLGYAGFTATRAVTLQ